jgi:hypothetical protein
MSTEYDPFDTAEREELDADRKAAVQLDLLNEINDLQWLMGNKRGRRIVQRLLAKTGLYRSSFNNSGSVTAFNEGQRNFGLRLMALIEAHCSDQYILMLQERNQ